MGEAVVKAILCGRQCRGRGMPIQGMPSLNIHYVKCSSVSFKYTKTSHFINPSFLTASASAVTPSLASARRCVLHTLERELCQGCEPWVPQQPQLSAPLQLMRSAFFVMQQLPLSDGLKIAALTHIPTDPMKQHTACPTD